MYHVISYAEGHLYFPTEMRRIWKERKEKKNRGEKKEVLKLVRGLVIDELEKKKKNTRERKIITHLLQWPLLQWLRSKSNFIKPLCSKCQP